MSDKHTPGPWLVDGDDIIERTGLLRGVYIGVPESAGGGRLAETFANCLVTEDGECRANARLIAAAPDLYAALQSLHDDIVEYARINNLGGFDNHSMKRARTALSLAGQQGKKT